MAGNLLIAHGGGPTAVINASLKGVIEEARKHKAIENILGARYGVEGILAEDFLDLGRQPQSRIDRLPYTPASAIGSCRRKLTEKDYPILLEILKKHRIRYFLYNGGNDSMDTCQKIATLAGNHEMRVIGIPKTIDNDLEGTDHCPGFGSAARYVAVSAMELGRDVTALPIHVVIMEVMGRNAGWLTAAAALGKKCETDPPHLICLPEQPFVKEEFLADVVHWHSRVKGVLVAASEGLVDPDGAPLADTGILDGFGHTIPGGVAQYLSNLLRSELGLKSRHEKPGLLGRASIPLQSRVDREEAVSVGAFAVKAAVEGQSGHMVSLQRVASLPYRVELALVPLARVANVERRFPLAWLAPEGNGVGEAFREYCLPLLGEDLPEYETFL